jgi:Cellulose biosynthesis protein BcsS
VYQPIGCFRVVAFVFALALTGEARAEGDWVVTIEEASPTFTYESSSGADLGATSLSVYASLTSAPFGDIREDGWRLRTSASYGVYRYARPVFNASSKRFEWPEFQGHMAVADTLLGYQATVGALVVKAFAGWTDEQHFVVQYDGTAPGFDADNVVQGERNGPKAVLETWLRLEDWSFLQTDVNWSEPFGSYGGLFRGGYRLGAFFSVGPELSVFGNVNHDAGRLGAFARLEWSEGEATLSGGVGGDKHDFAGGYASAAIMIRF